MDGDDTVPGAHLRKCHVGEPPRRRLWDVPSRTVYAQLAPLLPRVARVAHRHGDVERPAARERDLPLGVGGDVHDGVLVHAAPPLGAVLGAPPAVAVEDGTERKEEHNTHVCEYIGPYSCRSYGIWIRYAPHCTRREAR